MCIAVVGGIKRLEHHYHAEAERLGVDLRLFNTEPRNLADRLGGVDAIVVFTNHTSHAAKRTAVDTARRRGIPLLLRHACGVCALRDCVRCTRDAAQEDRAGPPHATRASGRHLCR